MKYSTFSKEHVLFENGCTLVAGIDEAGRGSLAGPVVAAVVAISSDEQYIPGVWDSKIMTIKRREDAFEMICDMADGWAVGSVGPGEIDRIGIGTATKKAMEEAYRGLELDERPDIVLIDGSRVKTPNVTGFRINAGDRKHYVISAASVIAKVTRDRLMYEYAERYPEYGFELHVGYGTKKHMAAIEKFGVTDIHRKSYAPVRRYLLKGTCER
jgi:ribonuclease HII